MTDPKRKPRHITLAANFGNGIAPDALHFDPKTGALRFSSNGVTLSPIECSIDFSYSRPRKEKVVRQYPISASEIRLHPDFAIYNVDTVYVVDTNTIDDLSVSCVVRGKPVRDEDGVVEGIHFRSCPSLVFKGRQASPERAAWREVILKNYSENDGVTRIVVDSDLSRLAAFNARVEPIIDDFFLPERVQLIYASADVGKEHIINQIISKADKAAARLLGQIRAGHVIIP